MHALKTKNKKLQQLHSKKSPWHIVGFIWFLNYPLLDFNQLAFNAQERTSPLMPLSLHLPTLELVALKFLLTSLTYMVYKIPYKFATELVPTYTKKKSLTAINIP